MDVNVLGYYLDEGIKEEKAKAGDVFLVYENEGVHGKFLEGYSPVGQHFELKDKGYLDVCEEIDKDKYKKITKGYYTPKEYI